MKPSVMLTSDRFVGIWKGKDEATPNGCETEVSKVISGFRALNITFALTDERQRCLSRGGRRLAAVYTTMRETNLHFDGAYCTGGGL